jgi:plastocyanin
MQIGEGAIATVVGAEDGPGEHRILMTREHRFDPDHITIRSGETIIWHSLNPGGHTSTTDPEKASDPSHARLPEGAEQWDSGVLASDNEFRLQLTVPGEYTYFCVPHQDMGMIGRITVEE